MCYQAIRASTAAGECGPFIDFMLDKILRTLKAKGKAYESMAIEKSSQKSSQKIIGVMKSMPDVTLAELANATGLSVAGVKKNIRKLTRLSTFDPCFNFFHVDKLLCDE